MQKWREKMYFVWFHAKAIKWFVSESVCRLNLRCSLLMVCTIFTDNLLNLLLMMRSTQRDKGSNSKQSLVSSSSFSSFNSTLVYLHTSNGKSYLVFIFFQLLPTLCSDKEFHPLRIKKCAAREPIEKKRTKQPIYVISCRMPWSNWCW